MSKERQYSDECLVIRRINIKEADRLVVALGREGGLFTCIAKGVRKIGSKKAGHLEPFSISKFYLLKHGDTILVTQAEQINSFHNLKSKIESLKALTLIGETIELLANEGEIDSSIYDLSVSTLADMSTNMDYNKSAMQFVRQALIISGFAEESMSSGETLKILEKLNDRPLKTRVLTNWA